MQKEARSPDTCFSIERSAGRFDIGTDKCRTASILEAVSVAVKAWSWSEIRCRWSSIDCDLLWGSPQCCRASQSPLIIPPTLCYWAASWFGLSHTATLICTLWLCRQTRLASHKTAFRTQHGCKGIGGEVLFEVEIKRCRAARLHRLRSEQSIFSNVHVASEGLEDSLGAREEKKHDFHQSTCTTDRFWVYKSI